MAKPYEMAKEFHQIFDARIPKKPTAFSAKEATFRAAFKMEELVEFLYESANEEAEFFEAIKKLHEEMDVAVQKVLSKRRDQIAADPLVGQVDALVDLLYLTYGSFALMGIDPEPIMTIVHDANMNKLFPDGQPHYDPVTNKVLKPASWQEKYAPEAKIAAELKRQKKIAQLES
ncbi:MULTISPECIES: hypothetical protein [Enterococcus]|uniref:Cof family protein n=1 Tax=Enterococcus dispar ATCC 51266 TaxID=1139219 RepID=S0KN05_9ENTE|nr:hypothetical protein [Enterococcus dispar]EOT41378.1 hypothetical protein OMK_01549 [Enterococcus dispar ATCC 51266]EOW86988.1 hypothetical protein I569_02357 [Enterococcus dispar ATCC 51266]OJG38087.1 hypothetical protein RV01_GL000540 [Enterococcus dispar]